MYLAREPGSLGPALARRQVARAADSGSVIPVAPGPGTVECVHWGPWANVAIVIGIISGAGAIVAFLWSVTRRHVQRVRRRTAIPAVEPPPQRAIQPPMQVIQAPIVIPSAQTARDGGAVSTFPGPGRTTGSSAFKTFEPGASRERNSSEPAFKPGITVLSEDSGHVEERP